MTIIFADATPTRATTTRSSGRRPPTCADWQEMRPMIERMYATHTIAQIREACGFDASDKMFRTRLRKWGKRDKKHKEHEVAALLRKIRQRTAEGKRSEGSIRNEIIEMEEIGRYCRRKPMSLDELERKARAVTPPEVECHTPIPTSIDPPAILKSTEHMSWLIHAYTSGSFTKGEWSNTALVKGSRKPTQLQSYEFYDLIEDSRYLFGIGDPQLAHFFQNLGFKQLQSVLVDTDISTVHHILNALYELREHTFHLSMPQAIDIIRKSSQSALPESHPLRAFWTNLSEVEYATIDMFAYQMYKIQVDCIEAARGPLSTIAIISKFRLARIAPLGAQSDANRFIAEMEALRCNALIERSRRQQLRKWLVFHYYRRLLTPRWPISVDERLALSHKVRALADEYIAHQSKRETDRDLYLWIIVAECLWASGESTQAIDYLLRGIRLLNKEGRAVSHILYYLAQLQHWLVQHELPQDAAAAHSAYQCLKSYVLGQPLDQMLRINISDAVQDAALQHACALLQLS